MRYFLLFLSCFPYFTAFTQCPDSARVEGFIEESYLLRGKEDVKGAKNRLAEAVRLTAPDACRLMRLWALSEQFYLGQSLQDFPYLETVSGEAGRYLEGQSFAAGTQEEEFFLLIRQYQATFYYEDGAYEKAYAAYSDIFRLLESRTPRSYEASKSLENAALYMASILKVWGEISNAREWYLKSLDYSQECLLAQPRESVQYLTYKHIGDCFLLQGQAAQALSFYRKGYFSLRKFLRKHPAEAPRLVNRQAALLDALSGYFLETARYDSAWTYLNLGLQLEPSPEMRFKLRTRQAAWFKANGQLPEALELAAQILKERRDYYGPGHLSVGETLLLQSEWLAAAGKRDEALKKTAEAMLIFVKAGGIQEQLRALDLQSRLCWEAYGEEALPDKLTQAHGAMVRAMDLLDTLGRSFLQAGDRQFLVERRYPLFERALLVNLEMDRRQPGKGYVEQAFMWAEKSKAIQLSESIRKSREIAFHAAGSPEEKALRHRIAELRDLLKTETDRPQPDLERIRKLHAELRSLDDAYAGMLAPDIRPLPTLKSIRKGLVTRDRGLLSFFQGDRHLFAFLLTAEDLHVQVTPLPEDLNVMAWVQSISAYYDLKGEERRSALSVYQQGGRDLYGLLIGPFEGKLPKSLWIIPDGELAALPFEALLTKDAGSFGENFAAYPYWIRDHTLAFGFSASSLLEQKARPRERSQKGLLAVAPEFIANAGQTDPQAARLSHGALFYNIPQARNICLSWRGDSLIRGDANERLFLEMAPRYRILHLATHGQADPGRGERSFLLLGAGKDTLFAWELMAQSLPAEMVVLSACETGTGQLRRGEGVIGLAWSFTCAGAQSVVTSLWSVYDRSTAVLMERFYESLAGNFSKDEALRNAKLTLMEDPEYAHPVHWAAFIPEGEMAPVNDSFHILAGSKTKVMLTTILQHAHSVWRWAILILLVWAIVSAFSKWRSKAAFTEKDRKRAFFAMTATHLQLLFGLFLYFMSPYVKFTAETMKDPVTRFYTVEHITLMLIAIFVISFGYRKGLNRKEDGAKFKTHFYYFLIGLLLILASIPWPFREGLSGAWF